nr:tRNA (N6-threonylcarbamoyladenosine(37)-N6)-methyltransferase TrmO [Candidatus Bathyarchaeota archaeon]
MAKVVFEPIGQVKVINEEEAEVVINNELQEALDGIEGFSHVFVIYYMHKVADKKVPMKVHPRGNSRLPLVGVLSTRSPLRPNCIGLTVVELLERKRNVLKVRGLDALDGSPILDVKPYIPELDSVPKAKIPEYIKKLLY